MTAEQKGIEYRLKASSKLFGAIFEAALCDQKILTDLSSDSGHKHVRGRRKKSAAAEGSTTARKSLHAVWSLKRMLGALEEEEEKRTKPRARWRGVVSDKKRWFQLREV